MRHRGLEVAIMLFSSKIWICCTESLPLKHYNMHIGNLFNLLTIIILIINIRTKLNFRNCPFINASESKKKNGGC